MMKLLSWLRTTSLIAVITMGIWILLDQGIRIFLPSLAFPDHYDKQNEQRYAAPYVEFKGAPNKLDHDRFGYRWVPEKVDDKAIKIAFFGGSTGYNGAPPIASLIESELTKRTGKKVQVANFSVVSSNHRQHLHNAIESRSIFVPDIVIFYGGYNETIQTAFYDPRPGYPYSYYFRNETPLFVQLLLMYSPTVYLFEQQLQKHGKSITPLGALKEQERPLSTDWNNRVIQKYFETLGLAKNVVEGFEAPQCGGKGSFYAFYQPYQVPDAFLDAHKEIRRRINEYDFVFDVSESYQKLGREIYTDIVHVKQQANVEMSRQIVDVLISQVAKGHACKSWAKGH